MQFPPNRKVLLLLFFLRVRFICDLRTMRFCALPTFTHYLCFLLGGILPLAIFIYFRLQSLGAPGVLDCFGLYFVNPFHSNVLRLLLFLLLALVLFNLDQIVSTSSLIRLVFELFLGSDLRLRILLLHCFLPPHQIHLLNAVKLLLLSFYNLLGVALVGGVVVGQI
jgi:hypothetical protein